MRVNFRMQRKSYPNFDLCNDSASIHTCVFFCHEKKKKHTWKCNPAIDTTHAEPTTDTNMDQQRVSSVFHCEVQKAQWGREKSASDKRFSTGNSLDPRGQSSEELTLSSVSIKNCWRSQVI